MEGAVAFPFALQQLIIMRVNPKALAVVVLVAFTAAVVSAMPFQKTRARALPSSRCIGNARGSVGSRCRRAGARPRFVTNGRDRPAEPQRFGMHCSSSRS